MTEEHLITANEVSDWLAGSAVARVAYHRTTALSARSIQVRGVNLARCRTGAYGQGFYSSTEVDEYHGDTTVTVAIRLTRPVVGHMDEVVRLIDDIIYAAYGRMRSLTPEVAMEIRRRLIRLGYDGLVINDAGGDGIDDVVALHPHSVRIVIPCARIKRWRLPSIPAAWAAATIVAGVVMPFLTASRWRSSPESSIT